MQSIAFYINFLRHDGWDSVDKDGDKAILRTLDDNKLRNLQTMLQRFRNDARKNADETIKGDKAKTIISMYCKIQPLFQWARTHHDVWFDGKPIIPSTCKLNEVTLFCNPDARETVAIDKFESELKSAREERHAERIAEWEAKPVHPNTDIRKERPFMSDASTVRPYHKAKAAATVSQLVEYWERAIAGDKTRTFVGHDELLRRWNNRKSMDDTKQIVRTCGLLESAKWEGIEANAG